jgi:hypothetical protein
MRALPISQAADFKTFLTNSTLAVGDVVALDSSNLLVEADRSNPARLSIVGFMKSATTSGPVVSTPVQVAGIVQKAGWNFTSLGQPVFVDLNGALTQDISGFNTTDHILEVGIAVGANQIMIGIKEPISVGVQMNSRYSVTSKSLFQVTSNKTNISAAAHTPGKLAAWTDSTTVGSVDNLTIPNETGAILTDASTIVGVDYGG